MKKILTVFFFMTYGFSNGQTFSKCDVYQYADADSTQKFIALIQTFNSSGLLTSENYHNFKINSAESRGDGFFSYFYKDTLLIKRTFVDDKKDSTKMLCFYNSKNQLVTLKHFTFKKRIKKDVHKGLGQPDGCIVTDDDYEKNRTWEMTSEIDFSYDNSGHKILYDATKLHFSSANKYTWTYDSLGRVLQYSSYSDQQLNCVEEYTYFRDEYRYTRTWFDYDGSPKQHKTKSWEYFPQYTVSSYLDEKGRVVKEDTITEKNEKVSTKTTTYNSSGQISRTVYLDDKGLPEITHIYIYH